MTDKRITIASIVVLILVIVISLGLEVTRANGLPVVNTELATLEANNFGVVVTSPNSQQTLKSESQLVVGAVAPSDFLGRPANKTVLKPVALVGLDRLDQTEVVTPLGNRLIAALLLKNGSSKVTLSTLNCVLHSGATHVRVA